MSEIPPPRQRLRRFVKDFGPLLAIIVWVTACLAISQVGWDSRSLLVSTLFAWLGAVPGIFMVAYMALVVAALLAMEIPGVRIDGDKAVSITGWLALFLTVAAVSADSYNQYRQYDSQTRPATRAYFEGYTLRPDKPASATLTRMLGAPTYGPLRALSTFRVGARALKVTLRDGQSIRFQRAGPRSQRWFAQADNHAQLVGRLLTPTLFYAHCHEGACTVRLTPRKVRHPFHQKDVTVLLDTMRVGLRWARREAMHGTPPE